MSGSPSATLAGTVKKIIKSRVSSEPEIVEIVVEGADRLYKELCIENTLTGAGGNEVHLTPGAKVEVTVEAEPQGVNTKSDSKD